MSLFVPLPKLTRFGPWLHSLDCHKRVASAPCTSFSYLFPKLCDTSFHHPTKTSIVHLLGDAHSHRQIASLPHVQRPCSL